METFLSLVAGVVILALMLLLRTTMTTTVSWVISESSEGVGIGASITHTGTGNDAISATITVPISTTNQENLIAFDATKIQSIIITTTADVTMYTNAASTGSPDDTIILKAGKPFVWFYDCGITRPIDGASGEISKLFFTNASSSNAAVVRIRGVQDA